MLYCGNKFILTISNKNEIVYEIEFTTTTEDSPKLIEVISHFIRNERLELNSSKSKFIPSQDQPNCVSMTALLDGLFSPTAIKDSSDCKYMSLNDMKILEEWILKEESFPVYIETVQGALNDILTNQ